MFLIQSTDERASSRTIPHLITPDQPLLLLQGQYTPHYRECQDISQQRICVITGKTIVEPNCVEGNLWQRDVGARVTECTVGAYKLIEVVITSVENVRGFRVWLFCVLQLTLSKVHRLLQACYYKIRQMIVQGGPKTNKKFRHFVFSTLV